MLASRMCHAPLEDGLHMQCSPGEHSSAAVVCCWSWAGTMDAPRPPAMDRQRSGSLPAHLAMVRDDVRPANRAGSKLRTNQYDCDQNGSAPIIV